MSTTSRSTTIRMSDSDTPAVLHRPGLPARFPRREPRIAERHRTRSGTGSVDGSVTAPRVALRRRRRSPLSDLRQATGLRTLPPATTDTRVPSVREQVSCHHDAGRHSPEQRHSFLKAVGSEHASAPRRVRLLSKLRRTTQAVVTSPANCLCATGTSRGGPDRYVSTHAASLNRMSEGSMIPC
jgi:hypothetical protein